MSVRRQLARAANQPPRWFAALDATFDAFIFEWDGAAVAGPEADAGGTRERIATLCNLGAHVFLVSSANVETVDQDLQVRPQGLGRLQLCCNQGSEIFEVDKDGPRLLFSRTASPAEDRALDHAAERTIRVLLGHGMTVALMSPRLNRRRIDLLAGGTSTTPTVGGLDLLSAALTTRLESSGLAGLNEILTLATAAAKEAGLLDARITSDGKHLEIGLTDNSDAERFAASWLAERGLTGSLIAIVRDRLAAVEAGGTKNSHSVDALARAIVIEVGIGPERVCGRVASLDGGSARLLKLLDDQVDRRRERRVPQIDDDPSWVVQLPVSRVSERVAEALGTLGNGYAGTRGSREEEHEGASPLFLVNGLYADDGRLLHGPNWTGLDVSSTHPHHAPRLLLDLRTAILARGDAEGQGLRSMRFVSSASPHAMALRAEASAGHLGSGDPFRSRGAAQEIEREDRAGVSAARTRRGGTEIAVAVRDYEGSSAGCQVIERIAAWVAGPTGGASFDDVHHRLAEAEGLGFDALLAEHRRVWARRWSDAEVVIEGDPDCQLAARFAVFHLLSAARETGEAAVGARGLTGDAYWGHVFWDADVFVLPVLAAIQPASARAMLEYRIRRLGAARAAAQAARRSGARFPWESAGDGSDVTPREVRGRRGEIIPIETGLHEEHIVADVAWAAAHYASWTGDSDFLSGPGRDLVVDTARYWASRIRTDREGHSHLFGVMGPDEYHEVVDDNAYTNVMARWNLRRGAELLDLQGATVEAAHWRALADGMVDGWSPERGVYEQFAGYFDLEPLLMSQVAPPPVAVDVLLGAERVAGSQLIKQADVLMLHHLLPQEVIAGSLAPCLSFYEPRTAHGSSLSPAIYASLLARSGQPDRALELFRLAARLDLDDRTSTTAGGVHLATMGGLWQALAYGFLGLHPDGDSLSINPCLPTPWRALGLKLRFASTSIGVYAEHAQITISCKAPLRVKVDDHLIYCEPPGTTLAYASRTAAGDQR